MTMDLTSWIDFVRSHDVVVDTIGYAGMILVATSMAFHNQVMLRIVTSVGSLLFCAYGVLIDAMPTFFLNVLIIGLNVHYFWARGRKIQQPESQNAQPVQDMQGNTYAGVDGLLAIMARLRDQKTGCAWDKRQTFASIAPCTIEEAYEVRDAINRNDMDDLCEELGDLLLQVVFHSRIATEQGQFTFADVCHAINAKMVRRHPHIFGNDPTTDENEIKQLWDTIKAQEKAEKTQKRQNNNTVGGQDTGDDLSLSHIAPTLPAVIRGQQVIGVSRKNGFGWNDLQGVLNKLDEEISEVKAEINAKNTPAVQDELGDVFFCMLILSSQLGLDAESVMTQGIDKFTKRFNAMELYFKSIGKDLSTATPAEMDKAWQQVKQTMA